MSQEQTLNYLGMHDKFITHIGMCRILRKQSTMEGNKCYASNYHKKNGGGLEVEVKKMIGQIFSEVE